VLHNCAGVPQFGSSLSFVHHHVELCVRVSLAAKRVCKLTSVAEFHCISTHKFGIGYYSQSRWSWLVVTFGVMSTSLTLCADPGRCPKTLRSASFTVSAKKAVKGGHTRTVSIASRFAVLQRPDLLKPRSRPIPNTSCHSGKLTHSAYILQIHLTGAITGPRRWNVPERRPHKEGRENHSS
jgi:hypothetical protein